MLSDSPVPFFFFFTLQMHSAALIQALKEGGGEMDFQTKVVELL